MNTNTLAAQIDKTGLCIIDNVDEIPENAFNRNTKLRQLILGSSITKIGNAAFSNCKNLQSVIIYSKIKSIPLFCFANCTSLVNVDLSFSQISIIETKAFYYCQNLISIAFPSSLILIKNSAFSNTGLKLLNIPNTVEELGCYCFSECNNIRKIVLPKNLKKIYPMCFFQCINLLEVDIYNTLLTTIPNSCFSRCFRLKKVLMSETVKKISSCAFEECNIPAFEIKQLSDARIVEPLAFSQRKKDFYNFIPHKIYCNAENN